MSAIVDLDLRFTIEVFKLSIYLQLILYTILNVVVIVFKCLFMGMRTFMRCTHMRNLQVTNFGYFFLFLSYLFILVLFFLNY